MRTAIVRILRALREVGWRGGFDVATAQVALLRARRALGTRPAGELIHTVGKKPRTPPPGPDEAAALERIAVAVRRAARYGIFRPTCLVRALALERLASRRGAGGGVVRIGVRRSEGLFEAHAWLEVDGRVVGDTHRNVERFTVLDDFSGLHN